MTMYCVSLHVTVAQMIAIVSERRAALLIAVVAHIAKANCRAAFFLRNDDFATNN